jgi:hypothetical protein
MVPFYSSLPYLYYRQVQMGSAGDSKHYPASCQHEQGAGMAAITFQTGGRPAMSEEQPMTGRDTACCMNDTRPRQQADTTGLSAHMCRRDVFQKYNLSIPQVSSSRHCCIVVHMFKQPQCSFALFPSNQGYRNPSETIHMVFSSAVLGRH